MGNITTKIVGKKLTIVIADVTAPGRPSSTGKTMLIASTAGALALDHPAVHGLKLALNLTKPVNGA